MDDFYTGVAKTQPASKSVAISDKNINHALSRGVFIGTAGDYEFYMDTTELGVDPSMGWVLHKGLQAGFWYPFEATGVRKSGNVTPTPGDVNFLY